MRDSSCGCGSGCGNQRWDAATRRSWSAVHAARADGAVRALSPLQPAHRIARGACGGADPVETAVGERSPREYGQWLASRWRGPQDRVSVPAHDTRGLRSTSSLYLGESPRWGSLIATLPRGQRPATPIGWMLADLLPEQQPLVSAWERAGAVGAVRSTASESPGLFFRGAASPHWAAWSLALGSETGRATVSPLISGPMPHAYRDQVPPDTATICADSKGELRLKGATPVVAWTWRGQHHVLEHARGVAAMADTWLWWAHRLHSYHHTDSRSPWDLMLARLAARRGVRWINRLHAEIRHLDRHAETDAGQEVRHAA